MALSSKGLARFVRSYCAERGRGCIVAAALDNSLFVPSLFIFIFICSPATTVVLLTSTPRSSSKEPLSVGPRRSWQGPVHHALSAHLPYNPVFLYPALPFKLA
jgi:hypothetical protein